MTLTAKPLRPADADELDDVLASHDPLLVEFYTAGCAMCQAMEPVLGTVQRAADVTVAMVNPGDDIGLVDAWNVRSVPTLVLVEDGEEVARMADGFQGAESVVAFLNEHAATGLTV
ncbi:thioredoxin domain-containing protein [Halomarina oriensis]|uniref:Thioredoxin n=1 Tax=Halomarina oriensis TaxID=671145 RepID=A0A6B0GDM4_9EURY|nr:thioredoxin [Halomarina oriensis]